jgi:transposase
MFVSAAEVARPTLRVRGLLGQAEPILIAGGRTVGQVTEVFVGIDVAKARNAVEIADGERGGEVRFLGEVDASEESMRRLVRRIVTKHELGSVENHLELMRAAARWIMAEKL